jgi:glycerol kinase
VRAVLALDQGTTGSTALVVDEGGRVLGRGYRELTQHFPEPGWVEHDPEEIWSSTLSAARDAIAAARVAAPDLAAIGITNQRETTILWDRDSGAPLHRAIVWQDRRTAPRCRELDAELIRARTGLVPDAYFSATKLEWLLRATGVGGGAGGGAGAAGHAGAARVGTGGGARGRAFGTVDTWLVHKLTCGRSHVTDPTNASRTMLYDIEVGAWDGELLRLFGVPREVLPEVRPSSGEFGIADAQWFGREIPIAGIAGDQQAALFGQGCVSAGSAKNTYGTGAFLLLNTGARRARSTKGLLTTLACDVRGRPAFALEGSVFIAGAAVQWLRDGLGLIAHASETEALARSVPDTGGVVFVPAFVGLGAPHWEPDARGAILGLTRGTTKAQIVRAALEAMAFSTREVLEAMTDDSGLPLSDLRVDGGAAANDWLMQFQADVLGTPVRRPDVVESTAMGAACLAGLATGVWASVEAFLAGRTYRTFEPGGRPERAWKEWQRAVRTVLAWARDGG